MGISDGHRHRQKGNVKVNTNAAGKVKYASAHDLRRSFGTRWSKRIMPQVLMQLMRHESINTTVKYYVDSDAQDTAELLYATVINNSRNTTPTGDVTNATAETSQSVSPQASS